MKIRHRLIMFRRIVKAGLLNFIRNAWLGLAAIAVMVITLTIILFSIIANSTFTYTITQITDKIDISVYLKDDVTAKKRDQLIDDLKNLDSIREVNYVSKDEALEKYKEQNQGNLDLLLAISQTDNPLPASLQIKPQDPNNIEPIKQYLEQKDIQALQSDETSYSGDRKTAIDKITSATSFIGQAGAVSVLVFAFISMLIIFNTIQMAIFNRRSEITIMRLLGASTSYIRGPFIVESVIYGIVSGVISIFIVHTLFSISARAFGASSLGILDIEFANRYFADNFWKFLGLQLGVGILIGSISALIATRRYLKFKTSK
ncbi:ABC transporter permease [Candidatus Saccharibacteria bacterium]|nr:ABC transporter permease [Candidatus Saccharibacteria bacterium]